MKNKVLVIDLDGTLYATNTFHQFIKYLLKKGIRNLDFILVFKLLLFSFLRLVKMISHSRLKYYILYAIKNKAYIDNTEFVNSIAIYKREIPLLYGQDYNLKILATAAPVCYSKVISKDLEFDACIATEMLNSRYSLAFENSKENKKENVVSYLRDKGLNNIDLLITDHVDDLPLISIAKKNIIINPDEPFEKVLQILDIQYEVVRFG